MWNSPDNQYSNQIDYILVSRRWKSFILDSRSYYWSAEMGSLHGSDRIMVRSFQSPLIKTMSSTEKFGDSKCISNRIIEIVR